VETKDLKRCPGKANIHNNYGQNLGIQRSRNQVKEVEKQRLSAGKKVKEGGTGMVKVPAGIVPKRLLKFFGMLHLDGICR
jgi:hypothetical protein